MIYKLLATLGRKSSTSDVTNGLLPKRIKEAADEDGPSTWVLAPGGIQERD